MIEVWREFGRFKAKNQRLVDEVKDNPPKMVGFLTLKYSNQQIFRQTHQQTPNTVIETLNTLDDNDPCTANTQTQTLTQEGKKN